MVCAKAQRAEAAEDGDARLGYATSIVNLVCGDAQRAESVENF